MALSIRGATEADVDLIFSLITDLAEYERLSDEVSATPQNLKETLFGRHAYAEVLIAEWGGVPVGFALFFHNYSTFLGKPGIYLEDLFVKPAYRGKGIGKALLIKLAQFAKERNCGRLEWAVLNWNESAIGFYKKLGAVPMTDWNVFRLTGEALDQLALKT